MFAHQQWLICPVFPADPSYAAPARHKQDQAPGQHSSVTQSCSSECPAHLRADRQQPSIPSTQKPLHRGVLMLLLMSCKKIIKNAPTSEEGQKEIAHSPWSEHKHSSRGIHDRRRDPKQCMGVEFDVLLSTLPLCSSQAASHSYSWWHSGLCFGTYLLWYSLASQDEVCNITKDSCYSSSKLILALHLQSENKSSEKLGEILTLHSLPFQRLKILLWEEKASLPQLQVSLSALQFFLLSLLTKGIGDKEAVTREIYPKQCHKGKARSAHRRRQ